MTSPKDQPDYPKGPAIYPRHLGLVLLASHNSTRLISRPKAELVFIVVGVSLSISTTSDHIQVQLILHLCWIRRFILLYIVYATEKEYIYSLSKTSSPFGRDMSRVELWLALRASHKCCQHMAGPLGQPYVYKDEKTLIS